MDFLKQYARQSSTWKGLALLGSTAAAVLGYGDIFSVDITEQGLQLGGVLGGVIGAAVPAVMGAYEVVRNQDK